MLGIFEKYLALGIDKRPFVIVFLHHQIKRHVAHVLLKSANASFVNVLRVKVRLRLKKEAVSFETALFFW